MPGFPKFVAIFEARGPLEFTAAVFLGERLHSHSLVGDVAFAIPVKFKK